MQVVFRLSSPWQWFTHIQINFYSDATNKCSLNFVNWCCCYHNFVDSVNWRQIQPSHSCQSIDVYSFIGNFFALKARRFDIKSLKWFIFMSTFCFCCFFLCFISKAQSQYSDISCMVYIYIYIFVYNTQQTNWQCSVIQLKIKVV